MLVQDGLKEGRGLGKFLLAVQLQGPGKLIGQIGGCRGEIPGQSQDMEDPHRLYLALHRHPVQLPEHHGVAAFGPGGLAGHDESAVKLVQSLEAGGQVDGVADGGVIEALLRAQIPHDGVAGVQADAHAEAR